MNGHIFIFTSLATGLLLFLSSCSGKAPEPINTQAVAYPMGAQQLEVKKMSVDTSIYAENALSILENDVYTDSRSYMQKTLPEI